MDLWQDHAFLRTAARTIFSQSLQRCSIEAAARAKWRRVDIPKDSGSGVGLAIEGFGVLDLQHMERIVVIAIGKAAGRMLHSLLEVLPVRPGCTLEGVLIAPEPLRPVPTGFVFYEGGHPLPNQASFDGARAALDLLHRLSSDGPGARSAFCFFLVSGGASAMMELPLEQAISLEETVLFHKALVHSGASIAEINCVRKHFSAVKGGRLRAAAGGMQTLTLAVSDVPASALDVLGSGPTLADSSTLAMCDDVLHRYQLLPCFPPAVRAFFGSDRYVETPKPDSFMSPLAALLSADDLRQAAQRSAEAMGFEVICDDTPDDWDYRDAASYLLQRFRTLRKQHARLCLVSAGEVTVSIPNGAKVGRGGRNQQLALHMATMLKQADAPMVVLSAGSDGIDGNSPAAGAVVDAMLLADAGSPLREQAQKALADFNAFPLLDQAGTTLVTGATGNNLRDLRLLLSAAP